MDVKEAVKKAKIYVTDLLEDENISSLGLEEVEYKDGIWDITLGFSRPWNVQRSALMTVTGEPSITRIYRVVELRDIDKKVLSFKRREIRDN